MSWNRPARWAAWAAASSSFKVAIEIGFADRRSSNHKWATTSSKVQSRVFAKAMMTSNLGTPEPGTSLVGSRPNSAESCFRVHPR